MELQKIVRRCLEKDPNERYQSIKDIAIELKDLRRELATSPTAYGAGSISTGASPISAYSQAAAGATQPIDRPTMSVPEVSTRASSAEYLLGEIKQHRTATAVVFGLLLVAIVAGVMGVRSFLNGRNAEAAIDSIAVLPFVNQNNDPEMEYQSDGLTESIINSLAQIPNVRVISRGSVFRYKGKETDPVKAGKELGVRAVLTGRVLQRGDNLTISTELVDVRENKQLWGEQYTEKVSDLMSMQRAIAGQITANLRLKLSDPDHDRVIKHYTESPEAYQLFLKGRFHWNQRTGESLEKSVEYFNQAIGRDPQFALAYAGLADAWFSRGW
ncbi:MAG: hypothetical protein LC775_20315, partial [Acidobacteria bacterium]|nr:hypothetical protein [Acidobacteriota bacterium]